MNEMIDLTRFLTPPQTIAVVGLSDKPDRPSYQVAQYLLDQGFTILPVNPMITSVLGLNVYPALEAIPSDMKIDIVDIFRQPAEVPAIVQTVIESGRHPLIWMQEGVVSEEAKTLAEQHGLEVVMDRCMMKEHRRLMSEKSL